MAILAEEEVWTRGGWREDPPEFRRAYKRAYKFLIRIYCERREIDLSDINHKKCMRAFYREVIPVLKMKNTQNSPREDIDMGEIFDRYLTF